MPLLRVLFEPEVLSFLFFLSNLLGIISTVLYLHSWPFSISLSCIYIISVFFITRRIASGRSYKPTKDLRGQTIIVTGAASGIGRVCALQFAKLGARVIIGVRGQERAEKIAKELRTESGSGTVVGYDLDVSSLANVKEFAEKIDRVDILLNNAGTLCRSFSLTVDGIENTFGTNHVGHFYLTKLLMPLLKNSRVVNVSSMGHLFAKSSDIDYTFSKLRNDFDSMRAYAMSKLAQVYHASELTRRYGIKAYSLHPGYIYDTKIQSQHKPVVRVIIQSLPIFSKTAEQGAMTSLYCALSDDAKPGHYHSNCRVIKSSGLALDARRAEECWNETEKLINAKMK